MKQSVRVLAFGPSDALESHVLGTSEREEEAVQPNLVAAENTAVRKLARGNALSNCYPKGIVTSIEIEMGRHVKASDNQSQIIRPKESIKNSFHQFSDANQTVASCFTETKNDQRI